MMMEVKYIRMVFFLTSFTLAALISDKLSFSFSHILAFLYFIIIKFSACLTSCFRF